MAIGEMIEIVSLVHSQLSIDIVRWSCYAFVMDTENVSVSYLRAIKKSVDSSLPI
jgi:hypothetical protein